jgi:hypothetical protein
MSAPIAVAATPRARSFGAPLAALALAAIVFVAHGRSLTHGLFLDDHPHFRQLRECDWSLAGLTAACRLELVGGIMEIWFLPEVTLRFFRPVAFGLMKLVYTLSDWSPVAAHAASLAWHALVCAQLLLLLRCLGASTGLAFFVAGLFAIHPGQIVTVQWIACQSELMVTAFLLGATLCFAHSRGWPGFAARSTRFTRAAAGVGCMLLFVLALGCRENAIMLPAVLGVVEFAAWRIQRKRADGDAATPSAARALVAYVVFALLIAGYLAVRSHYLGGVAMPPRPYVIPPSAPDFPRFIFDKICYYLIGEFFLIPCIPIGGLAYFQARPMLLYGLTAGAALILGSVVFRFRRQLAGVLAPAWMLLFIAPVLPAFASPHHLYLPGIGWAVAAMLLFRWIGGAAAGTARWFRPRAVALGIVLLGAAGLFGTTTYYLGLALHVAQGVEDAIIDEVMATPGGLKDGDTLYFVNLPLISHYIRLAVEERTGVRGLRAVLLTWSPRIMGAATPTEVTPVPAAGRTLDVRISSDTYFSGPIGLLVREATGQSAPARLTESSPGADFTAEVVDGGAEGIRALRFHFREPLDRPGVHVYFGSRVRWAFDLSAPWRN